VCNEKRGQKSINRCRELAYKNLSYPKSTPKTEANQWKKKTLQHKKHKTHKKHKAQYADKKIFVLGTASFVAELRKNGLNITETAEDGIDCVVAAYDSELTYEKLKQISKVLLTTDAPFYGTNPDLRCPIDFGFIPDCGAICNMITATTDRAPVYLGKPSRKVVELCLTLSGFSPEETLVVGDRLYTDIACGINAGVDTCVLFTGEAKPEDMENTAYPASYRFQNVKELLVHCTEAL